MGINPAVTGRGWYLWKLVPAWGGPSSDLLKARPLPSWTLHQRTTPQLACPTQHDSEGSGNKAHYRERTTEGEPPEESMGRSIDQVMPCVA